MLIADENNDKSVFVIDPPEPTVLKLMKQGSRMVMMIMSLSRSKVLRVLALIMIMVRLEMDDIQSVGFKVTMTLES